MSGVARHEREPVGMRYARPPIVEAVVGVRFDEDLDPPTMQRIVGRFQASYPIRQDGQDTGIGIGPGGIQLVPGPSRVKLTSEAGVLMVAPNEFTTSRLAPYPGWETFNAEVIHNLAQFRDLAGYRQIVRVGVRFINRIDIPRGGDQPVNLGIFLNIGPFLPQGLAHRNVSAYALHTQIAYAQDVQVIINTGSGPEVLLGHDSVSLDIDVMRSAPPQRIEAIAELLLDLRRIKNEIFEGCVTDAARALFEVHPL